MKSLLFAGAALALIPNSASATLQIAVQVGPDTFFCADNSACDTTPGTGVLTTAPATIDGILFSSTSSASNSGLTDVLSGSSLLIKNTTSASIPITITIGDVGFAAPIHSVSTAGSGTWQGPPGSSATLNWYFDAANAQGANNPFDVPGVLVDTDFSNSGGGGVLGFAHNGFDPASAIAPFSLTEQSVINLAPGESLVNRGQTLIASSAIPEPATWAMFGIGAAFLGFIGMRKKGRSNTEHGRHAFSI